MPDRPTVFGSRKPSQRKGGSAHLRDHSAAYRRLCASLMDQEPLCRYCRAHSHITPARVIDHIIALSLGGDNGRGNLAPACQDCNAVKAKVEQRFLAHGYDVRDIMMDPELAEWIRRGRLTRFDH